MRKIFTRIGGWRPSPQHMPTTVPCFICEPATFVCMVTSSKSSLHPAEGGKGSGSESSTGTTPRRRGGKETGCSPHSISLSRSNRRGHFCHQQTDCRATIYIRCFSPSFAPEGVPPDAKSVLQTPMIQVPGHSSPILVFRPWTDTDIRAAMAHLPPIQHSGRLFAEAFMDFCKPNFAEIRRVLMSHVGPTHYQKLNQLVAGDTSAADDEWSSNQNKPYRDALTALSDGIRTLFPDKVDMTPINNTKQATAESVHDYYQRLLTVFDLNSGIPQPAVLGDALGTWESHLKNAFMNGLLPDIKMNVQRSVAGIEDSRLADVKKHAALWRTRTLAQRMSTKCTS
ncbi:uncharacterized protein LOC144383319 [Gasterosteus aculeatus]